MLDLHTDEMAKIKSKTKEKKLKAASSVSGTEPAVPDAPQWPLETFHFHIVSILRVLPL